MKLAKIKVAGKVQAVYFRISAKQAADNLRLEGFARNEPDGTVYIEAEGPGDKVEKFIEWCRIGPELAEVESVQVTFHETVGHKGFKTL